MYDLQGGDHLETMTHLSFFYAHALHSYFGMDDEPKTPEPPKGVIPQQFVTEWMEKEGLGGRTRDRSDTVVPGHVEGSRTKAARGSYTQRKFVSFLHMCGFFHDLIFIIILGNASTALRNNYSLQTSSRH
jgi:hypothetical protein